MMLLAIAFGVLIGSMTTAMAQAYPSRPITIIVPFPPGGNTDIMARALQVEISKSLRQTIIINNKSGASGTLGIRDFVKAEPDGYTLALTPNNTLTAQPHCRSCPTVSIAFATFA
jgi:tripartite-type tricarboxylate transporter receptor subunit TctC